MSYGRITTETMTDIADAIRDKTGSEAQVTPTQMPERIRSIQTGNPNAVLYVEQELTEEEKAQARDNIGAVDEDSIPIVPTDISAFNNDSGYQTVPFAINIYEEDGSWHCSATYAQLVANAKNCYITVDGDDSGRYFPSGAEVAEDGSSAFLFCIVPHDEGGSGDWSNELIAISWYDGEDVVVQYEIIAASNDNPSAPGTAFAGTSWNYAREDHRHPKELPTVTASDNGKFLRVVSGAWAAATVPAAENASFGGGTT